MQNVDLRNKSYKPFLVKSKSRVVRKIIIKFFFSIEIKIFFFFKFLKIVSPDKSQKSHSFYKRKLQSLN